MAPESSPGPHVTAVGEKTQDYVGNNACLCEMQLSREGTWHWCAPPIISESPGNLIRTQMHTSQFCGSVLVDRKGGQGMGIFNKFP